MSTRWCPTKKRHAAGFTNDKTYGTALGSPATSGLTPAALARPSKKLMRYHLFLIDLVLRATVLIVDAGLPVPILGYTIIVSLVIRLG